MRPRVQLDLDGDTAKGLVLLLSRHLDDLLNMPGQQTMMEMVWAAHLILLLKPEKKDTAWMEDCLAALKSARLLLSSEDYAKATASRRLSWPSGSASTSPRSPDGRPIDPPPTPATTAVSSPSNDA